ncbi:MAG: MarR family transcriptional regulator [Nakamurella sp.]
MTDEAQHQYRDRPHSAVGGLRRHSDPARALRLVQQASADANQELARRLGIGITDVAALEHLSSSPQPLGPVELGHRLGIRSASATALVDRLEQSGHVRRESRPDDRRRIALMPSDNSRMQVLAALAPLLADIDAAAARLSDGEAAAVTRFLTEAAAAMHTYAHGGDPA